MTRSTRATIAPVRDATSASGLHALRCEAADVRRVGEGHAPAMRNWSMRVLGRARSAGAFDQGIAIKLDEVALVEFHLAE